MTPETYAALESRTLADAEGAELCAWVNGLKRCESAEAFLREAVWVILCSGVSYRAARTMEAKWLATGECSHPGKAAAIRAWTANHALWWLSYQERKTDADRIAYLATLSYMGPALRYQLAKNLGCLGVCKPDRHLIRIADSAGTTPQALCEDLSRATGRNVAFVDSVLWFAAMRRWWVAAAALLLLATTAHADPVPPRCTSSDGAAGYCLDVPSLRACDAAESAVPELRVQLRVAEQRLVVAAGDALVLGRALDTQSTLVVDLRRELRAASAWGPRWAWLALGAALGVVGSVVLALSL